VSADPSVFTGTLGPGPELLRLQELDLSIDRLTTRLEVLESHEEIRAARGRSVEVESRVGELKLAIDEVAREQAHLESDADSLERKIQAERKRMFDGSVVNPKELQSIEAEIANLTHRRTEKEDRVLELMERREELDARLSPVEAELAEARDREAEIERTSGQDLTEIRHAMAERTAEREELAGRFDPVVLDLYEELRQTKKGVAVAALEDGVCHGCHQKLSPVYLDRLKRAEGIWRCEYCRRILVSA